MGCSSTPLPDRSNAALQETANPTYPIHAARNRIEGYVQMSFDISESGDPINIKIIKADSRKKYSNSISFGVLPI